MSHGLRKPARKPRALRTASYRIIPMPHLLIMEARFYDDISDALLDGARAALAEAGATADVVTVPGALEIPPAIAFAERSEERRVGKEWRTRWPPHNNTKTLA